MYDIYLKCLLYINSLIYAPSIYIHFSMAIACFQEFLKCAKSDELLDRLFAEEVFDIMQDEEKFQDAYTILAKWVD